MDALEKAFSYGIVRNTWFETEAMTRRAAIDWMSNKSEDYLRKGLLYPKRASEATVVRLVALAFLLPAKALEEQKLLLEEEVERPEDLVAFWFALQEVAKNPRHVYRAIREMFFQYLTESSIDSLKVELKEIRRKVRVRKPKDKEERYLWNLLRDRILASPKEQAVEELAMRWRRGGFRLSDLNLIQTYKLSVSDLHGIVYGLIEKEKEEVFRVSWPNSDIFSFRLVESWFDTLPDIVEEQIAQRIQELPYLDQRRLSTSISMDRPKCRGERARFQLFIDGSYSKIKHSKEWSIFFDYLNHRFLPMKVYSFNGGLSDFRVEASEIEPGVDTVLNLFSEQKWNVVISHKPILFDFAKAFKASKIESNLMLWQIGSAANVPILDRRIISCYGFCSKHDLEALFDYIQTTAKKE